MYYKIVTPRSFFTDLYGDGMDVFNIPYGTVFDAPEIPKYQPDDPKCMVGKSVFHFADGAYDTMLWHTRLGHHALDAVIYEVEPLGDVKKERSLDSEGIYQCGAHKIKFLKKQDIDEMYDRAVVEYHENRDRYKNFDINVKWWAEHKTTVFLLRDLYDEMVRREHQRQKICALMHEDIQVR